MRSATEGVIPECVPVPACITMSGAWPDPDAERWPCAAAAERLACEPVAAKGGSRVHDGRTVWFCGPKCHDKFVADPVTPFAGVDLVCGMKVDRDKAVRREIAGRTVYFCGEHCAHTFEAARSGEHEPAGRHH